MATTKEPAAIETVTMEDGRIVEFAGKRKLLKESLLTAEGKVAVRMDFRNGATRLFTIPDSLLNKFAGHGAEQKLGDETAGEADVDDAVMAVDALIERLSAGEWGVAREGGGFAGTSVLARALAEFKGIPIEQVKEFLKTKTQAEKTAMRGNGKLKPIIERIEAEKASKGVKIDTDAILDSMPSAPTA